MGVWNPPPHDFAKALREAQEFDDFALRIHWCPWVEVKPNVKLDAKRFRLIAPEEESYKSSLQSLAGPYWDSEILKTALDLLFRSHSDRSMRMKGDTRRSQWRDPRDLRSHTEGSVYYVADVMQAFSRRPEMLEFLTQKGTAQLVLGLWQGNSKPFRWLPEISVCRKYRRSDLPRQHNDFIELFAKFQKEMMQDTIFLRIGVAGEEYGWLYTGASEFKYKGQLTCWRLNCHVNGQEFSWTDQAALLLENLTQATEKAPWKAWDSDWKKTVLEHVLETEMEAAGEEQGLGATFGKGDSTGVLNVLRSGSPRFLFEPFFEPVLQSRPELTPLQRPILLDSDTNDDLTREIHYTLYHDDPKEGRCLCGKQYPYHPSKDCPKVARLRGSRTDWIQECYSSEPGKRAQSWSWELLSSPHFYFCENPEDLLQDPKGTVDRRARKKTAKKWREVMKEIYGTEAVGTLGPEKS